MDFINSVAPLGLIGIFLGNELMLALVIESYGMVYIPIRVVVIPACAGTLIAVSAVRWWNAYHRDGERSKQLLGQVASVLIAGSIWAFQWFASAPLFMK